MRSTAWVSLLRRFPLEEQEKLMLVTTVNIEIAIQQLLVLDEEFMLVRGRLSGSSDTNRAFIIPYDQINYFGYQKPVLEADLYVVFNELAPGGSAAADEEEGSQANPSDEEIAAEEPVTDESSLEPAIEPRAPVVEEKKPEASRPAMADKAALLERLKARVRQGASRPPGT